jgi:hypothetical protein
MATTFSCDRLGSSFGAIICPSSFMILQRTLFAAKKSCNALRRERPVAKERLGVLAELHAVGVSSEVGVRGGFGDLHSPAVLFGRGESAREEAAAP